MERGAGAGGRRTVRIQRAIGVGLRALGMGAILAAGPGRGLGLPGVPEAVAEPRIPIFDSQTGEVRLMEKVHKSEEEWQRVLTPEQYAVMRKKGTERPFTGAYHNHHEPGIYQCVGCGTPLFSSSAKFDSGTGWPSFWESLSQQNVREEQDTSWFMRRTEVLCARCDAHLGHVFPDGPAPTHRRYCINSVALQFQKGPPAPGGP